MAKLNFYNIFHYVICIRNLIEFSFGSSYIHFPITIYILSLNSQKNTDVLYKWNLNIFHQMQKFPVVDLFLHVGHAQIQAESSQYTQFLSQL